MSSDFRLVPMFLAMTDGQDPSCALSAASVRGQNRMSTQLPADSQISGLNEAGLDARALDQCRTALQ